YTILREPSPFLPPRFPSHLPFLSLSLPAFASPPFFSFNDPSPSVIYTLSLHDALPIFLSFIYSSPTNKETQLWHKDGNFLYNDRSEERTSELQSRFDLVCRLLLEKKKVY